jgi:hypothetical protein
LPLTELHARGSVGESRGSVPCAHARCPLRKRVARGA